MRLLYCLVCLISVFVCKINTIEYMYPVASLKNETTFLYLHQFSPQCIKLFTWNTITDSSEQILWSLYNPAGLCLLPNNAGFSFVDNGRLRIKSFYKRAPKTVDFDEPIFNINALEWIDEHTCYCSAQHNKLFSIFQLHDNGTMHCLKTDKNKDCMYPQKIDNQLFYIERQEDSATKTRNYRIIQTTYYNSEQSELVINFKENPIIFLKMVSETKGFVLEHEKNKMHDASVLFFSYYQLIKHGIWQKKLLFTFKIPTCLVLEDCQERLFESILPLLPRIINNKIYFVDCSYSHNNMLKLYFYDLLTMEQSNIAMKKQKGHVFVPIACGDKLYVGGSYAGEKIPFASFLT